MFSLNRVLQEKEAHEIQLLVHSKGPTVTILAADIVSHCIPSSISLYNQITSDQKGSQVLPQPLPFGRLLFCNKAFNKHHLHPKIIILLKWVSASDGNGVGPGQFIHFDINVQL